MRVWWAHFAEDGLRECGWKYQSDSQGLLGLTCYEKVVVREMVMGYNGDSVQREGEVLYGASDLLCTIKVKSTAYRLLSRKAEAFSV